ncbi:MAG: hypothetical protein JWQ98_620 [Chlorobi bacterium]|nr:hypothetical protein [Chlorobiota bacterium]
MNIRSLLFAIVPMLFIPIAARAQLSIGAWGGIDAVSVPYLNGQGGLGYGIAADYRVADHWSYGVSAGILRNAFAANSFTLLSPAGDRTFQAMTTPVEAMLRYRTSNDPAERSLFVEAGINGTHFERDRVDVDDRDQGITFIPELSVFSFGANIGFGYEWPRFLSDRLRLAGSWGFSFPLSGRADGGDRPSYSVLRAAVMYEL